jgi:hypothetical protein
MHRREREETKTGEKMGLRERVDKAAGDERVFTARQAPGWQMQRHAGVRWGGV